MPRFNAVRGGQGNYDSVNLYDCETGRGVGIDGWNVSSVGFPVNFRGFPITAYERQEHKYGEPFNHTLSADSCARVVFPEMGTHLRLDFGLHVRLTYELSSEGLLEIVEFRNYSKKPVNIAPGGSYGVDRGLNAPTTVVFSYSGQLEEDGPGNMKFMARGGRNERVVPADGYRGRFLLDGSRYVHFVNPEEKGIVIQVDRKDRMFGIKTLDEHVKLEIENIHRPDIHPKLKTKIIGGRGNRPFYMSQRLVKIR